MAKIQTRMEKFKDYREQITSEEILEKEQKEKEVAEVKEPKKQRKVDEPKKVKKHALEEKKVEKVKVQKNIYDEYLVKKRLKAFLYVLFVLALVGAAIALLVVFTMNY